MTKYKLGKVNLDKQVRQRANFKEQINLHTDNRTGYKQSLGMASKFQEG